MSEIQAPPSETPVAKSGFTAPAGSPLSGKTKPEKINVRLFDLCRFQRQELLMAELITMAEYMWLSGGCFLSQGQGSPSPRRLENYDEIRKYLSALEEVCDSDQLKRAQAKANMEVTNARRKPTNSRHEKEITEY